MKLHVLVLIAAWLALISCNIKVPENKDHDKYFEILTPTVLTLLEEDPQKALGFIDSVFAAFPAAGIGDLCKKFDWKRAYYNQVHNYRMAITCEDSIISLLHNKQLQDQYRHQLEQAYFWKGDELRMLGKFDDSYMCYYKGRQIIEKFDDTCQLSEFNSRLGLLSYSQENFVECINYLQKAIAEITHCKPADFNIYFVRQQSHYNTMGLSYERLSLYDSAIVYYEKAINFITTHQALYPQKERFIQTCKAVVNGNLGGVYLKKKNYAEAEKLLRNSIAVNNRHGYDIADAQTVKLKLIDLLIQTGRTDESFTILEELKPFIDSTEAIDVKQKWYYLASQYYSGMREPRKANAYLSYSVRLKDSLHAKKDRYNGTELAKKFESIDQEYDLTSLKKNSNLQKLVLLFCIILLIMAIIIVFLISRSARQSRKNIQVLQELNTQISHKNIYLEEALDALEQSQADNKRMLKTVAHDLRNPISAMIGITELLQEDSGTSPENLEMLALLKNAGENSMNMLEDILKTSTSFTDLHKEPAALDVLIKNCISLLQIKASKKNQQIILTAQHIMLNVNKEKMWRVMSNLITNAIKFSPLQSVIHVSLAKKDYSVLIMVKDNGIGIPSEMKDGILSNNDGNKESTRRTGTSGEQSFGLGLSISRKIVEAHHGKLWFESEAGKGTVFFVELPFETAAAA